MMTHKQFRQVRADLGLSINQMADMLGLTPHHVRRFQMPPGTASHRAVNATVERLIMAYCCGYRPSDWPVNRRASAKTTAAATC